MAQKKKKGFKLNVLWEVKLLVMCMNEFSLEKENQ